MYLNSTPLVIQYTILSNKWGAVHLGTGHFYLDETLALCDAALDMGVKTVLTHPEWNRTQVPLELQIQLSQRGVYIEKLWSNAYDNTVSPEYFAYTMRELGPEHVVMGTDGAWGDFDPIQGIMDFVDALIGFGFSDDEIHVMLCETAGKLLEK